MHGEILKDLGECSDSAVKLKTEVWCVFAMLVDSNRVETLLGTVITYFENPET